MNKIIANSLFVKDKNKFNILRGEVSDFRDEYVGTAILKESIFSLLEQYASANDVELKILKYPINDSEIWAFTTISNGVLFVTINTAQPLNKQIFAAAHELYHLYCYIDNNSDIPQKNSILTSHDAESADVSTEDCEANAFAALLLAPKFQIKEQLALKGKTWKESNLADLISFMDIFAMPYKAMVIKLYECDYFSPKEVDFLLQPDITETSEHYAILHDIGVNWLTPTYEENISSLIALTNQNITEKSIAQKRGQEDINTLKDLLDKLPNPIKGGIQN